MHHDGIISPYIKHVMPEASLTAQQEATANLHGFLEVLYRIYLRLEREGRFPLNREKERPSEETPV